MKIKPPYNYIVKGSFYILLYSICATFILVFFAMTGVCSGLCERTIGLLTLLLYPGFYLLTFVGDFLPILIGTPAGIFLLILLSSIFWYKKIEPSSIGSSIARIVIALMSVIFISFLFLGFFWKYLISNF